MIEEHVNEDTWELVYRVMAGKMKESTPLIQLPEDTENGKTEVHQHKRLVMSTLPYSEDATGYSEKELGNIMKDLKMKKDPGLTI
ncbi:hypothetical protein PR048_012531 [Dryococelus australis]|uniref:Uncharacterized protein n=1 Tax=Dryococelus australis TaxID=614101 RepID=A0ABQ9HPN2_9NEOP|nr:hypothetical protein PR048_012531 [Dryococelus australis]